MDRCFTHKFLYTITFLKRWNMLFHTKLKCISGIYLLITMTYIPIKQVPITSGHVSQGNNVNWTKSMSEYLGPLLLCLQRRLSQLSEGIEIINGIHPCCQSISFLHSMRMYGELLSIFTTISNSSVILGIHSCSIPITLKRCTL